MDKFRRLMFGGGELPDTAVEFDGTSQPTGNVVYLPIMYGNTTDVLNFTIETTSTNGNVQVKLENTILNSNGNNNNTATTIYTPITTVSSSKYMLLKGSRKSTGIPSLLKDYASVTIYAPIVSASNADTLSNYNVLYPNTYYKLEFADTVKLVPGTNYPVGATYPVYIDTEE